MALKWALSSAYNIVIGHVEEQNSATGGAACNSKIKFPDGKTSEQNQQSLISGFQMPLHYPRYKKADYERMEEWKVDLLLQEYGLNFNGDLEEKRKFAMGAFLWPDQM